MGSPTGEFGLLHCQSSSRWLWGSEKSGPQAIGKNRGGWTYKIHMVALSCQEALAWSLTLGQMGDGPEGRNLIEAIGPQDSDVYLLMYSTYGGDDTRAFALQRNLIPGVPPNPQRKQPWPLDKPRYRQRNEVERLFRKTKAYRRVFTRYYKLDLMFASFVSFALICEQLRYVNTP